MALTQNMQTVVVYSLRLCFADSGFLLSPMWLSRHANLGVYQHGGAFWVMVVLAEVLQSWWSWSAHFVSTDFCDLEDKARHVESVRLPLLRLTLTDSVVDFLTLTQNHKDK